MQLEAGYKAMAENSRYCKLLPVAASGNFVLSDDSATYLEMKNGGLSAVQVYLGCSGSPVPYYRENRYTRSNILQPNRKSRHAVVLCLEDWNHQH